MASGKRGEIIFTPFPYDDARGTKMRPAVVLKRSDERLICAAITSVKGKKSIPWSVEIKRWREAGLKKPSRAVVNNIHVFNRSVCRSIGKLSPEDEKRITVAFEKVIQLEGC